MDQPKIERMLRLMKLLASNTNYTIDELAEKLKMSYRTIYRYIDTFKASVPASPWPNSTETSISSARCRRRRVAPDCVMQSGAVVLCGISEREAQEGEGEDGVS